MIINSISLKSCLLHFLIYIVIHSFNLRYGLTGPNFNDWTQEYYITLVFYSIVISHKSLPQFIMETSSTWTTTEKKKKKTLSTSWSMDQSTDQSTENKAFKIKGDDSDWVIYFLKRSNSHRLSDLKQLCPMCK